MFTLADVPTRTVWQDLRGQGFRRGVSRSWQQTDGTHVDIVLFQFRTTDQAYAFTERSHELLAAWPGCLGWTGASELGHGRVYTCPAVRTGQSAICPATFYRYELAGYLLARQPGRSDSAPVVELVERQAARLV